MQLLLVFAGLAALFSSAACQSAPYYLTPVTNLPASQAGVTSMLVRDDRFTVTPANNNVAVSATAVSNLEQINHVSHHHIHHSLTKTHHCAIGQPLTVVGRSCVCVLSSSL